MEFILSLLFSFMGVRYFSQLVNSNDSHRRGQNERPCNEKEGRETERHLAKDKRQRDQKGGAKSIEIPLKFCMGSLHTVHRICTLSSQKQQQAKYGSIFSLPKNLRRRQLWPARCTAGDFFSCLK